MNAIDHNVRNIFLTLVNSNTKYIKKIDYSFGKIIYKVGNHTIELGGMCQKDESENTRSSSETFFGWSMRPINLPFSITDCFAPHYFTLIIDGKFYIVNGLSRVDYAQALELLDDLFSDVEEERLTDILSNLTDDEIF